MGKTIINSPKNNKEENRIKRVGKKKRFFCFRKNMEWMGERYRGSNWKFIEKKIGEKKSQDREIESWRNNNGKVKNYEKNKS